jgi:hypothetical protein
MPMRQRSKEWFEARRGIITCSRLNDVLRMSGPYARQLREEREGQPIRGEAGNPPPPLAWGIRYEDAASAAYCFARDVEVADLGFFLHPNIPYFGGSCDGLVQDGTGGLVEIKVPFDPGTHHMNLIHGITGKDVPQVQGLMAVFHCLWCDFVSFDPREPMGHDLSIHRVHRETQYIEHLIAKVHHFERMVTGGPALALSAPPTLF